MEKTTNGSSHGYGGKPTGPSLLQRLRISPEKEKSVPVPAEKDTFDFNVSMDPRMVSMGRNRSSATMQSTLGAGDDFEEIAVPPPTFGGYLIYKSTEISITSESIEEARERYETRPKTPAMAIGHHGHHDQSTGWEREFL
ncbi:hypothetical protein AA313_de0209210 [Arthrobotrys entomopaga]|nr:hypothetical protein AA313_de0209210 [Arthrobotrys entomopaga]